MPCVPDSQLQIVLSNPLEMQSKHISNVVPIVSVDNSAQFTQPTLICPELSQQHKIYTQQIRRFFQSFLFFYKKSFAFKFILIKCINIFKFSLFEEMVNTERETKELLEFSLLEKKNHYNHWLNSSTLSANQNNPKNISLRTEMFSIKNQKVSPEVLCDVPILKNSNFSSVNNDLNDSNYIIDNEVGSLSVKR